MDYFDFSFILLFVRFCVCSMNPNISSIDEIVPGKVDWCFRARVVHLWRVPNIKNTDEVNGIEFLLLDEKVERQHLKLKFIRCSSV